MGTTTAMTTTTAETARRAPASRQPCRRPGYEEARNARRAVSATPPADRPPWHEVLPERLEWELAEFAAPRPPGRGRDRRRLLVIETAITLGDDNTIELEVRFPFDYLDVEPTVAGPRHSLTATRTGSAGNFLLEDPTLDWWPTMSAAGLVDEDVRWLIEDSRRGPDAVREGEADMPEPLSQHIPADSTKPVIVTDPFWVLDSR